ncbi:MAG TPA: hypothetical protein PK014_06870 [Thermoanaerobaculia bacterium]|nr:hypothetical protein [Thermoanaerobaculia bacterium]HUM29838.1 hypothetical protein [Thermoanaerobaculia bacterium]HXK68113.1 hypothetical protein [Thermoanaerobaculia bacterium]
MKRNALIITALVLAVAAGTFAAGQSFTFTCRTKIIRDGYTYYEYRPQTYTFTIEIISDERGVLRESRKWNRPFVSAEPGERYSIRIHNPMPIPVAVNLAIDGLNSITGDPGKPDEGKKWIIDPYSYVTIRGWQVSSHDARRFFFTTREDSYATWQGNRWGKDLSVNCGVIGAAFFWSKREMEQYYESNPIIEYTRYGLSGHNAYDEAPSAMSQRKSECMEKRQKAGTGMGERETHPVRQVRFDYDTGMYQIGQAVILFYDFPDRRPPYPRPFEGSWAPEMP